MNTMKALRSSLSQRGEEKHPGALQMDRKLGHGSTCFLLTFWPIECVGKQLDTTLMELYVQMLLF